MNADTKKQTSIALKKAKTSLERILKMLDEDKYCIDILQQILAVNGLLKSASNKVLESHLSTCFIEGIKENDEENHKKLIKEVVDIVSLNSKNK